MPLFYAGRYLCKSGRYIHEYGRYIGKSADKFKNVVDKIEKSPIKHIIDPDEPLSGHFTRANHFQTVNIYHKISQKCRPGASINILKLP